MSEILNQENAIILAAAQKLVALSASASEKFIDGDESGAAVDDKKAELIIRLLTAYRKKDNLETNQLESILYDLRKLSGNNVFPTVNPIVGQELQYIINEGSSGDGHIIEDEGAPLAQRNKLNFVGAGVTVTDDSGDDATVVTIPGGGGGGVAIAEVYGTIAAMLADQGAQSENAYYWVTDATTDGTVTAGWAIYRKLAASTANLTDYVKVQEQESLDITAAANGSETVAGVFEEATNAEMQAGTATGGTGAKLTSTPAKLATWWTWLKTQAQTFAAQITFTTSPIISALTASKIVATNGSNALDTPYTFRDEDDMSSDDATGIPSQQSVKAYVDSKSSIGVQDLYVPATAMWPRTTGPCGVERTEIATSLVNIQSLSFDQTTQENGQFSIVFPRNWNNGTVTIKFYWTAASGSGDVIFGISGGAYSNDDALSTTLGTAQEVTDTLITANDVHITSYTSALTIGGTPADSDFIFFNVYRKAADGGDTLNADAKLLGIVITLTTDAATAA